MTQARTSTRTPALDDPRLRPFLPMLYVAWADGDLADEEMAALCSAVDPKCQALLRGWLDPSAPPSAEELARMLALVRSHTADMDRRGKLDLTGLGLEIAQADAEVTGVERTALESLEEAMGIAGTEAARQLLSTRRPARREREADPEFDLDAMKALLDGRWGELRRRVFRILAEPEFEHVDDLGKDAYRERVLGWCRRLAEEGLGALSFDETAGGGGDIGAFISAFENLAYFDLSLLVKFGVQFGLFGGSIQNLGTEHHHGRYLPAAGRLELPGCFAMTETGHGSNVADLETTARFDVASGEFVIHTPHVGARKDYIGNAACHGELATVFAQLELDHDGAWVGYGVHAFLVPIRDEDGRPCPGVNIEDDGTKLGLNGVDNGRLDFDQVRIPRENLLDRFASVAEDGQYTSPIASPGKRFFTMLGTLVGGRVSVALGALSAAKAGLAIAIRYGAKRRQFGPADVPETRLLDYQTHQRRLMPRLAQTYALHFALDHLRELYVASDPLERREVETEAAGLKAYSTWHTTDVLQTCRECCGGQGYLAVNRFAALKADTDVFTTFEGDNIVLLQLVAKALLGDYRRQFGDMKVWGLVRYVADRAAVTAAELNPVVTRLTGESHLRDPSFQRSALAWREQRLVSTVARRLKRLLDAETPLPDALGQCQSHLVAAAKAHTERLVLDRFADAVDACADPGLQKALGTLRDLYALWRLELDRGYFLERGYFEAPKAKAIQAQVDALCAEARTQAVPLVEAFGIPERLLAAPIAR